MKDIEVNSIVVCKEHFIYDGNNFTKDLNIGGVYNIVDVTEYNDTYSEVYIEFKPGEFNWFPTKCFILMCENRDDIINTIVYD